MNGMAWYLDKIKGYMCCGIVWRPGERCLAWNCPVSAEAKSSAAEVSREKMA